MQSREIKALSDADLADLRAGRGMRLALPAELNGYPGPMHVLEHADALELSPDQRMRTMNLVQRMRTETIGRGEELISAERALDALFRDGTASPAALSEATGRAATAMGRLREAHLRYHLETKALLTPEQVERYNVLRGYRSSARAR